MDTRRQKRWNVFYSWQSDLPKEGNQNAIRMCLRESFSTIESDLDEITIYLDEATRDTPGSPDIPSSIFEKISIADIFVCDVTTINSESKNIFRRTPNPNVLVELGYAVGVLGWERIILLFNKMHGDFPNDLPFDIDRRRILNFKIDGRYDKNGKGDLLTKLKKAVDIIIRKEPQKPHERKKQSPKEKKKNNDVANLRWLLNTIHIPTMDHFIEEIPSIIIDKIFHFWEGFKGVKTNSLFHVYDEEAKNLIDKLFKVWECTLSYSNRYSPSTYGDRYFFGQPLNRPFDSEEQKDWELLQKKKIELNAIFKEFLAFIRVNYLEIDLNKTSQNAIDEYTQFENDFLEKMNER